MLHPCAYFSRKLSPAVFTQLKSAFCTAQALSHPDPNIRFVVEVDAATLGVGAILSQWKGKPPVLHPCAYFSRKLSPAEQNYDVGNRELLAIKLALEEWRHWLEGAQHPFVVITDHKNLQYLQEAKRLNPRQARWALFFTRFRFKISYRPGSKNIKADALSRLHQPDPTPNEPEPILPHSIFFWKNTCFCGNSTTKSNRHSYRTCSARRSRREELCTIQPTPIPSGLLSTPLWDRDTQAGTEPSRFSRTGYWWPNMARDVAR